MPNSFEELATRACDFELQIVRHVSYLLNNPRDKNDPNKEIKDIKTGKSKEVMTISTILVKIPFQRLSTNPKPKSVFRPNKG